MPRSCSLLLEEVPAAVSFVVLVPERGPDEAVVVVMIEPALPRCGVSENACITYHTFNRGATPTPPLPRRESETPMPTAEETEWREIGGS